MVGVLFEVMSFSTFLVSLLKGSLVLCSVTSPCAHFTHVY